jgi:hypothetical protein
MTDVVTDATLAVEALTSLNLERRSRRSLMYWRLSGCSVDQKLAAQKELVHDCKYSGHTRCEWRRRYSRDTVIPHISTNA